MKANRNEPKEVKITPTNRDTQKNIEPMYSVDEFAEQTELLNASSDVIRAAFREKKLEQATVLDAKNIVKEFKERKVQ